MLIAKEEKVSSLTAVSATSWLWTVRLKDESKALKLRTGTPHGLLFQEEVLHGAWMDACGRLKKGL